jgi:hypothetical protein
MENEPQIGINDNIGERRTHQMMIEDISSKLSSKNDWYKFLE